MIIELSEIVLYNSYPEYEILSMQNSRKHYKHKHLSKKWFKAIKSESTSGVADLLRYVNVNQTNSRGRTGLMISCQKGCLSIAKLLIQNRASINHLNLQKKVLRKCNSNKTV